MTDKTLYLIQSEFSATPAVLTQLGQIATTNDSIVLCADAVLFAQDERIKKFPHLYVLKQDAELMNQASFAHLSILDYDQFANLVLNFTRCVSLK